MPSASDIKASSIDWDNAEIDAQVPINTQRSLFLSARGPSRDANQPAVIIEAGMGDGLRSWCAVQSSVSKFARVYSYDRAGIGRSEPWPDNRSAENIASDLSSLLEAARILPPYIIICHSYGGILAREFLAARPDDVVGMIFVDTNTENTIQERAFPFESLSALCGNLNYSDVTVLDEELKLSPTEWEAAKSENSKNEKTAEQEYKASIHSSRDLAAKHQFERRVLKDHPVVVIKGSFLRDCQRVYDAGVAAGNGTEEQRADLRRNLAIMNSIEEKLQKEQLRLSSSGRYLVAAKSGHGVMLTEPELIAGEVEKVLQAFRSP